MSAENKLFCPLIKENCREEECAWFVSNTYKCAVRSVDYIVDGICRLKTTIEERKE